MSGRARATIACACAALAGSLFAACGDGAAPGRAQRTQPVSTTAAPAPIVITQPADGSRLRARVTRSGALLRRVRLRGDARPGSVVRVSAGCRPQRCLARATAAADGRWSAFMTLTTTSAARFVTIDAGDRGKEAAPAAVATIELAGPRPAARASDGSPAPRRRARSSRARAQPAPRTLPQDVLVIGDSLAVGMEDSLSAALPGWRVQTDARIGRPLAEGMRILAAQRDTPAILAFSLFTNDDPRATDALAQAVRATATRPGGCAVWATIVAPPVHGVTYAAANGVLERLAAEPAIAPGLQIADWRALVAGSPALLAADGVHGTPAGYEARGQQFAAAIRACAEGGGA